jgi:hypothetical protein
MTRQKIFHGWRDLQGVMNTRRIRLRRVAYVQNHVPLRILGAASVTVCVKGAVFLISYSIPTVWAAGAISWCDEIPNAGSSEISASFCRFPHQRPQSRYIRSFGRSRPNRNPHHPPPVKHRRRQICLTRPIHAFHPIQRVLVKRITC